MKNHLNPLFLHSGSVMIKLLGLSFIFGLLAACSSGTAPTVPDETTLSTQSVNIRVSTSADELNHDGDCSLREAITAAVRNVAVDRCPAGSFVATDVIQLVGGATYTLTNIDNDTGGPNGLPAITPTEISGSLGTHDLIIEGNGATIERHADAPQFRLLYIAGGRFGTYSEHITITISNLTLRNGYAERGGAILAGAGSFIRLDNVRFENNQAMYGGALMNRDYEGVQITNSSFHNNHASKQGGALHTFNKTFIDNTTFSDNSASQGGAIYTHGYSSAIPLRITRSSIYNNRAAYGAAVFVADGGGFSLENSTLSSNTALIIGGGIYFESPAVADHYLFHSTIAFNEPNGLADNGPRDEVHMQHMLIAHNGEHDCDFVSVPTSSRYPVQFNLDSDNSCRLTHSSNLSGVEPLLGPLSDNGGPTLTHALLAGSPAINAGEPHRTGDTDQQGAARVQGGRIDIGAYESSFSSPRGRCPDYTGPLRSLEGIHIGYDALCNLEIIVTECFWTGCLEAPFVSFEISDPCIFCELEFVSTQGANLRLELSIKVLATMPDVLEQIKLSLINSDGKISTTATVVNLGSKQNPSYNLQLKAQLAKGDYKLNLGIEQTLLAQMLKSPSTYTFEYRFFNDK